MKMTPRPSALARSITWSTSPACRAPRWFVGSSRMMTRLAHATARPMGDGLALTAGELRHRAVRRRRRCRPGRGPRGRAGPSTSRPGSPSSRGSRAASPPSNTLSDTGKAKKKKKVIYVCSSCVLRTGMLSLSLVCTQLRCGGRAHPRVLRAIAAPRSRRSATTTARWRRRRRGAEGRGGIHAAWPATVMHQFNDLGRPCCCDAR